MEKRTVPYNMIKKVKEQLPAMRSISTCSHVGSNQSNSFRMLSVNTSKCVDSQSGLSFKEERKRKKKFNSKDLITNKDCSKPNQRPVKRIIDSKKYCKNRNPGVPVRFYSAEKIKQELRFKNKPQVCKIGSIQDLILLKSINAETSKKQMELDRFYNEKIRYFQVSTTPDGIAKSFLKAHRNKHVKFCL